MLVYNQHANRGVLRLECEEFDHKYTSSTDYRTQWQAGQLANYPKIEYWGSTLVKLHLTLVMNGRASSGPIAKSYSLVR